jgi:hypothetical protein
MARFPCTRIFPGIALSDLRGLLYPPDRYRLRKDAATAGPLVLLLRRIAKGEPPARLAHELWLSRKQLHTLRRRIQANLNDSHTDADPADVRS